MTNFTKVPNVIGMVDGKPVQISQDMLIELDELINGRRAYSVNTVLSGVQAAQDTADANTASIVALDSAYQTADSALQANIDAEATARANADSAEAILRETLEARVTTTEGDIGDLESADVTLQANIDSEATARAAADSAEATLREALEASVRNLTLPERPVVQSDFVGVYSDTITFEPSGELSDGTITEVSGEGQVMQFASDEFAGNSLGTKAVLQISEGGSYKVTLRARVTVDATTSTNRSLVALRVFDAGGSYLGSFGVTQETFDVADGWVERTMTATAADIRSTYSTAAYIRAVASTNRRTDNGGLNNATTQVSFLRLSDEFRAAVSVLRSAFVDSNGDAIASFVVEASAGADPARIGLRASNGTTQVLLEGDQVFFGPDAQFETTHNTIYVEDGGGERYRILGPFGTSSDLLEWFGPDSVSLNSETKTNGYFAKATDGVVYKGTESLGDLATADNIGVSGVSETDAATSPTAATWTTVASVSLTTNGTGVALRGSLDVDIFGNGSVPTARIRLVRTSTTIKTSVTVIGWDAGSGFSQLQASLYIEKQDNPAAGTYTYKLQAYITGDDGAVSSPFEVKNRSLIAQEIRAWA